MLLDAFMGFLVLVGGVQFVYCVVGGNYVSLPIHSSFFRLGERERSKYLGGQFG